MHCECIADALGMHQGCNRGLHWECIGVVSKKQGIYLLFIGNALRMHWDALGMHWRYIGDASEDTLGMHWRYIGDT